MKRVIAFFLLTVILNEMAVQAAVMGHYLARYQFYVVTLCENKDKPELNCNGTCVLSQEIQKISHQNQSEPSVLEMEEHQWYVMELLNLSVMTLTVRSQCEVKVQYDAIPDLDDLDPPPQMV